jgi:hypothetical protein
MKREPDLIREILLKVEAYPKASGPDYNYWFSSPIGNYSWEHVSYHVLILDEGGFLIAHNEQTTDEDQQLQDNWIPVRLTWQGHEFLDAARDANRWRLVKKAMGHTGGFVVGVAQQVLVELVKAQATKYLP